MYEHTLLHLGEPLAPGEHCHVSGSRGLVVFVHPDGSARSLRRAQPLLMRLQARGLSTLDFDLLTAQESEDPERLCDVPLLTARLDQALAALPAIDRHLPIGLLASDTGTAAALTMAVRRRYAVGAVVSRSGRPDLADDVLGDLRTPTLLVVGAADPETVEINRAAFARMRCEKRIDVVPRATHHFLEAGALDVAAQLAGDWFCAHLAENA